MFDSLKTISFICLLIFKFVVYSISDFEYCEVIDYAERIHML